MIWLIGLTVCFNLTFSLTTDALAQGIMETGNLYGLPSALPSTPQLPRGLGNVSGTTGLSITQTDLQSYGEQANKLYQLAKSNQKKGQLANAIKLYKQSLIVREHIWGSSDPAVAVITELLGNLYLKQGALIEAEDCFKKTLRIAAKRYGPGSPELLKSLNQLALFYNHQKRYGEALSYYKQVLALQERYLGLDHQETLKTRHELAILENLQEPQKQD